MRIAAMKLWHLTDADWSPGCATFRPARKVAIRSLFSQASSAPRPGLWNAQELPPGNVRGIA